jgi:hypothetical protein
MLVAADAAFIVVFGVFVVAFVVLAAITVTWAVRRDRAGRAEWERRQRLQGKGVDPGMPPPPPNGRPPDSARRNPGAPR